MESPRALEEQLRRHPHDMESWLVYADWLSEQGDPRGELIGLEHREMQPAIDALIAEHQSAWSISDLPPGTELVWRHGFAVGVTFPCSVATVDRLEALLSHPSARLLADLRLHFEGPEVDEEEVFDGDYESPTLDLALIQRFVATDLSRIRSLTCEYGPLGDAGAEALIASPQLGGLTSLDLRYARLGDAAMAALAGARQLEHLTTLRLQRNRIGAEGARSLAESAHLDQITILDLRDNPIGPEGAQALASSPHLRRLAALYLYREDVGTEGAAALSTSAHLPFNIRRYWAAVSSSHAS